tara:strand:- start:14900 stop:15085 length:186 start_codon:yes stop_codon:yes gene_type:complete
MTTINTKLAEELLSRQNYDSNIQDGFVIVQDPFHSDGVVAGHNEVVLRTNLDLIKFLEDRN